MPKCPECNALYETGDDFCPECGKRLKKEKAERPESAFNKSWVITIGIVMVSLFVLFFLIGKSSSKIPASSEPSLKIETGEEIPKHPDCNYGKIEEKCTCGEAVYRTGYCCNAKYSLIPCTEQSREEKECVLIKLKDNDHERCESGEDEEKTVEILGLILTYAPGDKVMIGGSCIAC